MFQTESQFKTWCEKQGMDVGRVVSHREDQMFRAYLATKFQNKVMVVEYDRSINPEVVFLYTYVEIEKRRPFTKSLALARKTKYNIEKLVGSVVLRPHLVGVHSSNHEQYKWE